MGQPPLRTQQDQDALWDGIARGTIHTIGTDHVAYTREQKLDPTQTVQRHRAGMNNLQVMRPMLSRTASAPAGSRWSSSSP